MSHMEDDDPPIKSHPASKEYRDNFDRVFGEKMTPAEEHEHYIASGEIPGVSGSGDDSIECTLKMYANYVVPVAYGVFPAEPRVEAAGNTQITEPSFVEACRKAEKPWERKKCNGMYDDGIADGNLSACCNREGCGLEGCPAADFGHTTAR